MGVIRMYGIRNCDTVKKARAWLEERGVPYQFQDYKVAGVDARRLQRWAKALGWEKLLNRSGPTFRKIPESRKTALDEARALALMVEYPSAIKRPVVEFDGGLVVGFKPELYSAQKWK
jgi:arsenate reductase (glutaredoxin)